MEEALDLSFDRLLMMMMTMILRFYHYMSLTEGSCGVSIGINISSKQFYIFYVWLTVHPGMILAHNQLDPQFFIYVYFYSLHVSGSHVPIIRRIIATIRHLVYVTLYR